jgi:hypothetical protein
LFFFSLPKFHVLHSLLDKCQEHQKKETDQTKLRTAPNAR